MSGGFGSWTRPTPLIVEPNLVRPADKCGEKRIEVTVTDQTRDVMGVTCLVVRDTVSVGSEVVEDTYDWYAQDLEGNVWYLGEDSKSYKDGAFETDEGSWESGVDGAMPGIVMMARPLPGTSYRQEYLKGEAEDMGKVLATGESVSVSNVTYDDVVVTLDYTPLEPDALEYKYYAPGVGLVMEEAARGDGERAELVEFTTGPAY